MSDDRAVSAGPPIDPSFLDVLPALSTLLKRLTALPPPVVSSPRNSGAVDTPTSAIPTSTPGSRPTGSGAIAPKDVPVLSAAIRARLTRAHAALRDLPDATRSIAEQEAEIQRLLERIGEQKRMLVKIDQGSGGLDVDRQDGAEETR
jgi:hypothetical protein